MQTVVVLASFDRSAKKAGATATERQAIINMLAAEPDAGEMIVGTGGARKVRVAPEDNTGKSGGYRVITFYGPSDVPVFLLGLYGKGQKSSLTKAEKNDLATILSQYVAAYRASTKAKAREMAVAAAAVMTTGRDR